jgi:hypothetical protein
VPCPCHSSVALASQAAVSRASVAAASASAAAARPSLSAPYVFASTGIIAEGTTGRALISAQTNTATNTPQTCATYCTSIGFPLSGTEFSSEWSVFASPSLHPDLLAADTSSPSLPR